MKASELFLRCLEAEGVEYAEKPGPTHIELPVDIAKHEVVRCEWDSVEGHQQEFRASPRFGEFFAPVRPFFVQIEEMTHYSVRFEQAPGRR